MQVDDATFTCRITQSGDWKSTPVHCAAHRLIASGTHTTALLLGLTASHYSRDVNMVGLEFRVRFRRPIYADETIKLEWLVVKVTPNEKLRGDIVELRGRIKGEDGQTALGARGRVLVTSQL